MERSVRFGVWVVRIILFVIAWLAMEDVWMSRKDVIRHVVWLTLRVQAMLLVRCLVLLQIALDVYVYNHASLCDTLPNTCFDWSHGLTVPFWRSIVFGMVFCVDMVRLVYVYCNHDGMAMLYTPVYHYLTLWFVLWTMYHEYHYREESACVPFVHQYQSVYVVLGILRVIYWSM